MSHIDVTPLSMKIDIASAISMPLALVTKRESRGSFARGLACGLVLGLSFWTFVAVELFSR